MSGKAPRAGSSSTGGNDCPPPAPTGAPDDVDMAENDNVDGETGAATASDARDLTTTVFPHARIRKIIRADPDVNIISADAVFVVAKAAELFLEKLSWVAYETANGERRRTVQYRDLVAAVESVDEYFFLEDILPSNPKYVGKDGGGGAKKGKNATD
ncbi:DNA polymerase epsilon subunit 4 [Allomyces arbusculus]|nr:DNA polymerase epsilon subunit 4 [Allomyces arbusculus]